MIDRTGFKLLGYPCLGQSQQIAPGLLGQIQRRIGTAEQAGAGILAAGDATKDADTETLIDWLALEQGG